MVFLLHMVLRLSLLRGVVVYDGNIVAVVFWLIVLDYIFLLLGFRHQGHLFWWRFNGKGHRVILTIAICGDISIKSVFYFKEVVLKLLACKFVQPSSCLGDFILLLLCRDLLRSCLFDRERLHVQFVFLLLLLVVVPDNVHSQSVPCGTSLRAVGTLMS